MGQKKRPGWGAVSQKVGQLQSLTTPLYCTFEQYPGWQACRRQDAPTGVGTLSAIALHGLTHDLFT